MKIGPRYATIHKQIRKTGNCGKLKAEDFGKPVEIWLWSDFGYCLIIDVCTRCHEMALISEDFLVSSDSGNDNPHFTP